MNQIKRIKAAIASLFGIGMLMDSILEFSDAQDITLGGPVAGVEKFTNSTNTINFGDLYVGKAIGRGTPVYLNVTVNTVFDGTASSVLDVYLNYSADGNTWASGTRIGRITEENAATVGMCVVCIALPASEWSLHKYLQLVYTGTGMTSGAVDAWLSLEAPRHILDTVTPGWTA